MLFRNVSPLGDLVVHLESGPVEVAHGDTVEATGAEAESLLAQPEVWKRVDKPRRTKEEEPEPSAAETQESE